MAQTAELSDAEVFGTQELSDAQVFEKELTDSQVFGDLTPKAPTSSRSFLSRIWDGFTPSPYEKALAEESRAEQMIGELAAGESPGMPGGIMSPGFKFPRTGKEGTIQRGISETVGGIVEGALSPGGALLAAGTLLPGGPQLVGGTMAGLAAKQAGQQLGEASVTGNVQTATEGALAAVLAPLTTAAVAGPEFIKTARIRGEQATAALNQADLAARARIRPGPENLATPEVLRDPSKMGLTEVPVVERPEGFQAAPLSWDRLSPQQFEIASSQGVQDALLRYQLARQRRAELSAGKLDTSGETFQSVGETPGFLQTAEQREAAKSVFRGEPTRFVDEIDTSTPLKTVEELVRKRLEQRDWAGAVADLGQAKAETSTKIIDTLTGKSEKSVPLSAGERLIFNEIWDKALEKAGYPAPTTPDIIIKLENLKTGTDYGKVSANPFPEIASSTWNTALDIAIGAIKAGRSIESALSEALGHIRKNASGFDEAAVRAALMASTQREAQPSATPGPLLPPPKGVTLEDVYKRFEPEKKPLPTIKEVATKAVEGVRTGLSSKYRPLDKLAEDIAGTAEPKRVAHIMEQLAGSSGKAEADIYRFDRAVTDLVKGNERDFNAYMFLRRSIDRLQMDAADLARAAAGEEVAALNRRRVSEYTIPQLQAKLRLLENNLKPEMRVNLETAAQAFQEHMDKALSLQLESGRMSQEVYNDIKTGNQFYAPFKILKYIEETSRPEGSGRKVDTTADYTKAITGIDDPNFKLGDMLAAARRNLTMSRILADKNLAMQKVAQLAADDPQGVFIRRLGATEKAARDKANISVMENGKIQRYEVNEDVAAAVQTYNSAATDMLARGLSFVQRPMKLGATGLNVVFQPINLFIADTPRAALVSKFGVKTPADLMRFPLDWVHAFYSAMKPRFTGRTNPLYMDFLDSGAAGSTVQDFLSPEALRFPEKSKLAPSNILNTIEDFGRAIEEINKVVGIKRAMRETGATTGAELQKNFLEAITEVRRFSGSPDFWRLGKWTEAARLNLIFNFFNARLQGGIADVGRLAGRDGLKTALETNAKVGVAVGVPTVLAYLYNNLPQYAADYAQRPKNERDNYWLIPKDTYITDDNGNKIRDYWRIPKRELGKLVANTMEAGMRYAQERDPAAFWALGMNLLENLSPISIEGRTSGERIESMVSSLNPVLKAPIELGTGRDTFRHRDIVPDVMKQASPEEQYIDRTPALFKRLANGMPDVLPELVRSPLMLENITVNFTAGLITQFLTPEKPIEGREGIASSRFMRRFQAVPYTENAKVTEELNSLKREAADEFLKRDRTAKSALSEGKPLEDALNLLKDTGDIKLLLRTIDLWLAQQNGITFDERRILSLPIEQRAQFVANQIKTLDADAKAKLLEDYVRKRILTKDVLEELAVKLNPETK